MNLKGVNSMETYEVLEKAADYMDEHGQCRGRISDAEGRVCAVGAIRAVSKKSHPALKRETVSQLRKYLNKERPIFLGGDVTSVATHNDGWLEFLEPHPNMSEAMRLCAKQLRADND